jgi:hypothetical protein
MSTAAGETGADYLALDVGLGTVATDGTVAVLLFASLILQLQAGRYEPWRYWVTVVLVSAVGCERWPPIWAAAIETVGRWRPFPINSRPAGPFRGMRKVFQALLSLRR